MTEEKRRKKEREEEREKRREEKRRGGESPKRTLVFPSAQHSYILFKYSTINIAFWIVIMRRENKISYSHFLSCTFPLFTTLPPSLSLLLCPFTPTHAPTHTLSLLFLSSRIPKHHLCTTYTRSRSTREGWEADITLPFARMQSTRNGQCALTSVCLMLCRAPNTCSITESL